ncbi:M56 family metallopeptidase [Amycolatopsis sp. PS_44_ISF1]|uniref:M56 family metallopeptidase n=1 Tax=Amycolatopsis sp. PS_44_ISF1 TaxID=2974917 RepID=UPI0028DED80D|nr:M56 family metallopeptidase [Amycolatopsis sp. PS_44_ISF1]MDT8911425.1 M56 family metallopeptidase [Amycolatopsis sp. PS_44_ISF1]
MSPDFLVPLLLPVAAWPVARRAPLPPRAASWLLAGGALVLALGSTAALAVQAAAGLSLVPAVAELGRFSPAAFGGTDVPLSTACGLALAGIGFALVRAVVRYRSWHRRVHAELDAHHREAGFVLLPGAEPVAFAVAGGGGRIAVSSGMLAALGPRERRALLAHERAHLRLRHHRFAAVVTFAATLNPLVRPLATAARFSLERWADEAAADQVGDRRLVATAVAKAALATAPEPSPALAATGGPVPRRVLALLSPKSGRRSLAVLAAAAVLTVSAGSAATALDSAADFHTGIEIAQRAGDR